MPTVVELEFASRRLMKDLGYGKNYQYAHDHENAFTIQDYLPESLDGTLFYHPSERGYESVIKKRLSAWRAKKRQARKKQKTDPSG